MRVYFARSLDRPVEIFGLRGTWILVFLFYAGAVLVLSFLVGFVLSTAYGLAVFLLGLVGGFFLCLFLQSSISYRQLKKLRGAGRVTSYVARHETISRALYKNRIRR